MNYKSVNTAILNGLDIPKSLIKDKDFYNYLLGNNIAYYYASKLSSHKTSMDQKIITAGNRFNGKYFKTLKLINKICKKNKIRFLLFKTYKYIPEAVDNDIDLLVKESDFHHFMEILEKTGFDCIENEPLKGICKKNGFCTIEPRINSSFHGIPILDERKLWNKIESVNIKGIIVFKPIKEVEVAHLMLSLLYNPNYLRLYLLIVFKSCNLGKLNNLNLEKKVKDDLKLVINNVASDKKYNERFPIFISDVSFVLWWYNRMFSNPKMTFGVKIKHVIYFFYLKYSYILFNKLIFMHKWPLS